MGSDRSPEHTEDKKEVVPIFLTDKQVSQRIGIPVATLRRWRLNGTGPRYNKFGRSVRYNASEVVDYIERTVAAYWGED